MGTTRVLHYVFIQTQCVGEWKRTLYAVLVVPIIWRLPSNQGTDFYFSMMSPIRNGMSMKKKFNTCVFECNISYSACVSFPVLKSPENFSKYSDEKDTVSSNNEEQQPLVLRVAHNLRKHRLLLS
jgi:hypothetical protein